MENKHKYGEFFTPNVLIDEIINQLPIHIWNNPHLRWLDPCAGQGNFFIRVFHRLMTGLEIHIKDPIKRREHIITKMLFMVEINQDNENQLIQLFGTNANIVFKDFLDINTVFDTQFDIILGNPPYQSTKTTSYIGSVGNRTLWDKFLWKCFTLNALDGYIGFITPANWRRPNHKLYTKITRENRLLYLHIYNKQSGLAFFNAQTRFDLYIIMNNLTSNINGGQTTIIDEQGTKHIDVDLDIWPFLPNFAYNEIHSFLIIEPHNKIIHDSYVYDARKLSKIKNELYRYPVIHSLTKKGIGIRYTKFQNYHFKSPKIILNFNEKQYPVNDFHSKYGMSQLSFGISINSYSEGERIINVINSSRFKVVLAATKWNSFQTDYRMFKYLEL